MRERRREEGRGVGGEWEGRKRGGRCQEEGGKYVKRDNKCMYVCIQITYALHVHTWLVDVHTWHIRNPGSTDLHTYVCTLCL